MAGYQIDTTPSKITKLFPSLKELKVESVWLVNWLSEGRSYGSPFLGLQLLQKEEVWTVYRNLYTIVGEKSIWSGISFDRECLTHSYSWSILACYRLYHDSEN